MTFLNLRKPPPAGQGLRRSVVALLVLLTLASALAWGWQVRQLLGGRVLTEVPSAQAPLAAPALPDADELARWLGASPAGEGPAPGQRFTLLGVMADAQGGGVALIAVDGRPARPFVRGAELAPGWTIQRLAARQVHLGQTLDGPSQLTLNLPPWPPAAATPVQTLPQSAPPVPASPSAVPPARESAAQSP